MDTKWTKIPREKWPLKISAQADEVWQDERGETLARVVMPCGFMILWYLHSPRGDCWAAQLESLKLGATGPPLVWAEASLKRYRRVKGRVDVGRTLGEAAALALAWRAHEDT